MAKSMCGVGMVMGEPEMYAVWSTVEAVRGPFLDKIDDS
jgi:hypothetical protein